MKGYQKKEIAYERILFFSDAIVAIAITLLALDLKVNVPVGKQLSFGDIVRPWHQYLAYILSFFSIASYWKTHHDFFLYIKQMNEKLLYLNIGWLFFIVSLPFSTSVLSDHFGSVPAIFLYSANIFMISVFQNFIWDYTDAKTDFLDKESLGEQRQYYFRLMLNLDMINGLIAMILCFFLPKLAFFTLFFKLPVLLIVMVFVSRRRKVWLKQAKEDS